MARAMYVAGLACLVVLLCGGLRVDPAVEVLEVVLAADVSERQPQRTFSPPGPCRQGDQLQTPRIDPTRHPAVVLWTRVKSAARLELMHTYYRAAPQAENQESGWQEVAAVPLSIGRSSGWRTWSEKTLTQGLEGAWKVEITIAELPDTVLCTVHFFVLSDAVWQALTEETHVREMLCRMAKTSPPPSLFRAGREVLKNQADRGDHGASTATLLSGWERFMQYVAASDRLFCAGGA